jgi:tetratricopeptide (TPR) repeat protein
MGGGAVSDRLLVELGGDGRVSVGSWLEGDLPGLGEFSDLVWPLDEDALEDLRWYLEDYLRAPFGVYGERGPKVQARLADWGQAVFSAVFGTGPARDAYVRMRARRAGVEVVFRSASPVLLGLPWELMVDPGRPTPLALDVLGVSRSLPVTELPQETFAAPGGRLRVLMVISRPAGTGDVGYRMIARPLLGRLEAVRGQVELVVLRPPTLDALAETLAEATEADKPFQVVHFDGHGALDGRRTAGASTPLSFHGPGPEGVLVFEKPGGGPDEVPASRVAQVLKAAQVPVVVLNACQSGAVGKQLEAAVATRLLQEGIASVVAMAYTVYAVAAAEFIAAFYERLFAGDTVSVAVTAGRRRLFQHDLRPSPKGDMSLADWVVPVHYLRRDVSFPQAVTARSEEGLSLDAALDRLREPAAAQEAGAGSLDPVGAFVGRDALFFELEAAVRLQRVVVLTGPGGTGKTELAKAFGRWWRDTGGVEDPQLVFWHSFERGVASFGLDGVITEIGLGVFGPDFAALDTDKRRQVVQNLLAEHRLLLIWDNFETVATMPDPAGVTPPLGQQDCQELKDFLVHVADGGRSAVIITSRAREDWLGTIRHLAVGGLAVHEAAEYVGDLLAPYPAAQSRRGRRAFGELMQWLDGHPLSMRLILPHLEITKPEALLDGLRGAVPLPGGEDMTGGRTTSLAASIAYSYSHLSADTRRRLAAVSLFQGVADADVLAVFSRAPGVPGRFADIGREEWGEALDEAARVGLLTSLGAGMYQIHPALPAYLAAQWRAEEPDHDAAWQAATDALLTAYADLGGWLRQQIESGDARLAFTVIGLQRRTMGSLLGYALEQQLWKQVQAIGEPLDNYWQARGLSGEADTWADRVRLATENPDGTAPLLDTPAGSLWAFFTSAQAARQVSSHHLDQAEDTYQQILASLQTQPSSPQQQAGLSVAYHQLGMVAQERGRLDDAEQWYTKALTIKEELGDQLFLATTHHQLGIVAQKRGRLDDAEDWYTKALTIREELGDRPHLATDYHQLGMVAYQRGRLEEAEDWYAKCIAIDEELGNRPGMAIAYHQLGNVAYQRGRPEEAEDWYTQSLAIAEEFGDRPNMASTYHQLGMVAQLRGRLDEAEDWYTKALAIKENLSNRPGMAITYHQLGRVAQDRGRLDEAEDWYAKSLAIKENLSDRPGMASTFGQLGLLAEERGQLSQALEWTVRCVALFAEFPHPAAGPGPQNLARLTDQLGISTLEGCWQTVTGNALPQAVRDYVESSEHPGGA